MDIFKHNQQLAVQMVAILWKLSCEYAGEELYEEVRNLMEIVIMAESEEELNKAVGKIPFLRVQIELACEEKIKFLEQIFKQYPKE